MKTYFECGTKYQKTLEDGSQKRVTEIYLVEAMSFTDAEARFIENITPFITGEFTVSTIKRANYSELFRNSDTEADRWFKCKVSFITLDEKSGREKKSSTYMLVNASSMDGVVDYLHECMKGTISDYEIASVTETEIIDVFYFPKATIEN